MIFDLLQLLGPRDASVRLCSLAKVLPIELRNMCYAKMLYEFAWAAFWKISLLPKNR